MSVQNEIQRLSAAKASIAASLRAMGAEPPQGTTLDQYAAQLAAIASAAPWLPLAGGTMEGALDMGGYRLSNLPAPQQPEDAVRKQDLENTDFQAAIQDAQDAAGEALSSATVAETAKAGAVAAQSGADQSAMLAESWAVGGTGSRTGEDTNNAKYWAEQSHAAADGGVSSFNGRYGFVTPEAGDYTAEQVGAIPQVNGAAGQLLGFTEDNVVGAVDVLSRVFVSSPQIIPAGQMLGDVNGDGKITAEDADLAQSSIFGGDLTSEQKKRADMNEDGAIRIDDAMSIRNIVAGVTKIGAASKDVTGNWSVNPKYATDEAQFYIDISVSGLTTGSDIAIAVQGDGADQIVRVEARDGAFRVYARLLPVNPLPYKLLQ